MTVSNISTTTPNPGLHSGRAIAKDLLDGGEVQQEVIAEPVHELDDDQKKALNERFRAERFGIQGAITYRYASNVVTEDPESGRPVLKIGVAPRPLERRARLLTKELEYGPNGWGNYEYWELFDEATTQFDDFQKDFELALEELLAEWGADILTSETDTEVLSWAERLVAIGQQQRALNIPEAILADQKDALFIPAEEAPTSPAHALERLPLANISLVYGEMAEVTLDCLDQMGVSGEDERLKVLDDIVLQARDISQHHIAHFSNGESDEVDSAPKLKELGASLIQDDDGRWHLDWQGRVKPKPKDKVLSRTQKCVAAYRLKGQPSAIERLGWAFNTGLQKRGLLKPGTIYEPVHTELPEPVLIPTAA